MSDNTITRSIHIPAPVLAHAAHFQIGGTFYSAAPSFGLLTRRVPGHTDPVWSVFTLDGNTATLLSWVDREEKAPEPEEFGVRGYISTAPQEKDFKALARLKAKQMCVLYVNDGNYADDLEAIDLTSGTTTRITLRYDEHASDQMKGHIDLFFPQGENEKFVPCTGVPVIHMSRFALLDLAKFGFNEIGVTGKKPGLWTNTKDGFGPVSFYSYRTDDFRSSPFVVDFAPYTPENGRFSWVKAEFLFAQMAPVEKSFSFFESRVAF